MPKRLTYTNRKKINLNNISANVFANWNNFRKYKKCCTVIRLMCDA